MNPLEKFHKKIDESDWDAGNHNFNESFQQINTELSELGDENLLRKSEVERWTFAFNKLPDKGLKYRIAGTKTLENGKEVPFVWPNKDDLLEKDFEYLIRRFKESKNKYAKTEYGLLLYYCEKLVKNGDIDILLDNLIDLGQLYYKKTLSEDIENNKHYFTYLKILLGNSLKIAYSRKKVKEINKKFEELIYFISDMHRNWDLSNNFSLKPIYSLTELALVYKRDFNNLVSLESFLKKNYEAAKEISKTYKWGSIEICNISIKLADYLQNKDYDWDLLKAQEFEGMIDEAIRTGNLSAVKFAEYALEMYKKIDDKDKIKELEKKYDELRRVIKMGEVKQELPQEEVQRLNSIIDSEIKDKNGQELIETLMQSPMFRPLDQIFEISDKIKAQNLISNFLPASIIDKFGNTVDVYVTEEEKSKFRFWETYEHSFQIGEQTLEKFFIKALTTKKISFEEVEYFLLNTWIGETYNVTYLGETIKVCPYDIIKPGLELYFKEIISSLENEEYEPNFICSTDSLITKCEYLLRFFCELGDIATFTKKHKGPHKYYMEKNIDEILGSLEHSEENPTGFSEEHRLFIHFILSNKMGKNLRHKVAHGLMDPHEYHFMNPLFALLIILKISGYSFNK